jgi:hypothetical protein
MLCTGFAIIKMQTQVKKGEDSAIFGKGQNGEEKNIRRVKGSLLIFLKSRYF